MKRNDEFSVIKQKVVRRVKLDSAHIPSKLSAQ